MQRAAKFILAVVLLFPATAHALGDLTVAPTRLVFDQRERTAEVTLTNTGTETATYRIMLVNRRMRADGSFEMVAQGDVKSGERFANQMIRFTPKIITLPPGVGQTVRVQIRKPAALAAGEYRSHLMFQSIPRDSAPATAKSEAGKIGVELTPVYGATIPVIVRHGETMASAALTAPRFARGPHGHELVFDLQRRGTRSLYGDLEVALHPASGDPIKLSVKKGIAVYTPNEKRTIRIPWDLPEGTQLSQARLDVQFQERGVSKPQRAKKTVRFR